MCKHYNKKMFFRRLSHLFHPGRGNGRTEGARVLRQRHSDLLRPRRDSGRWSGLLAARLAHRRHHCNGPSLSLPLVLAVSARVYEVNKRLFNSVS
jgi:hypothetical protein